MHADGSYRRRCSLAAHLSAASSDHGLLWVLLLLLSWTAGLDGVGASGGEVALDTWRDSSRGAVSFSPMERREDAESWFFSGTEDTGAAPCALCLGEPTALRVVSFDIGFFFLQFTRSAGMNEFSWYTPGILRGNGRVRWRYTY